MDDARERWERVREFFPQGDVCLGPYYQEQLLTGHILFTFARYKFASRLIERNPKLNIIEMGCNEGLGTLFLARSANSVQAVDFDEKGIEWAKKNIQKKNVSFRCDDFLNKKYGEFDAVVSLDVIEHIKPEIECKMLETMCNNLNRTGFAIIGTPNLTANSYASKTSKEGHINLYDAGRLEDSLSKYFNNVFIFGMNDELAHLGFRPMTHYLMALACNKK